MLLLFEGNDKCRSEKSWSVDKKVHVFFYISHVFCAKVVDFFRATDVRNIQPAFRGSKSAEKRRACEDYTFYVARSIFRLRGIWSKARKPVTLP